MVHGGEFGRRNAHAEGWRGTQPEVEDRKKKDAETENKDFDEPPRPIKGELAKGGNG